MQVGKEAMYSMRKQSTGKWTKKPCIICGTIYKQMYEEAMYSMQNNLHASE